ncbi:MAG: DUF1223 domain-containing protein [Paracoccaceae bacterium]
MIKKITQAILMASAIAFGAPPVAEAGDQVVVVELYTSQGCSSCPPADALMHTLAEQDDLLPLALHVDYWDYIGWKDIFADPANTARQKAYAETGGRRMIYTPQMIVMGLDDVVGADRMKVSDAIDRHRQDTQRADLTAVRRGDVVEVTLNALAELNGTFVVQLVRFTPAENVAITRGELAGRIMDYTNIVREWRVVGQWDGVEPMSTQLSVTGDEQVAVIVQHDGHGPIVAAAIAK